jgi:anti-sigma-K factor RskA
MTDPNRLQDGADKAYGAWNTAGTWVAAHPKTAIVATLVVVAGVIWLTY